MAAAALKRMNEAKGKLILVLALCNLLMIDHTNSPAAPTDPAAPAAPTDPAAPAAPTDPAGSTGPVDPKGEVDTAETTMTPVNTTVTIVDTSPTSDSDANSTAPASASTVASTPGSSATSPQTESIAQLQETTPALDTTTSPLIPNELTETQGPFILPAQVHCVRKEDIQDKDAIQLELKKETTCEEFMLSILNVKHKLCNDDSDCSIAIYQKPRSKNILISSSKITENPKDMASYFNDEKVKDQLGLMTAAPHWRKHSPSVLVSLVITGLLLAALLIGGYCYKKRMTGSSKGERLNEDLYQVESDNQDGTLVSVAPCTPVPQGSPALTGHAGHRQEPAPTSNTTTTNGHSAKQAPVADTEL
ncbi:hematopoietic progenitor cell antigen CD34-like isoform X1 [Acipenser oxyrinchus oxyrinchus]|uniref:Hematopoietic progenitor cell antigen CD34-like isoform X1 n=1 Tax=Acipenser oxyrinchus oxyrinchus TaxID=40147 RepID=A0AAD8FRJ8_ACIOX|nr:hematopoietic progenitor cell antigen CD34-like isoform X1 [Acipenser oxyrinchus oxyrinchus]